MRYLGIFLTALSMLVLAACGDSGSGGAPSRLVPENVAVYGTVTLDPKGDQERAVSEIAARFPGGDELGQQIEKGLAEAFREDGVDYAKDVEPWLGDELVFFISGIRQDDADGAAVIETSDEDATLEAFDKLGTGKASDKSYEGTDYKVDEDEAAYGVVDGRAVIGTEAGFKAAVDTAAGDSSIEDSDRVTKSLDSLPEEPLASVYLDGRKLLGALGPEGALLGPLVSAVSEPYVVGVSAESDAVVVDSTLPAELIGLAAPVFFGSGTDAVLDLPADSFFAAGQPEVGESISQLLTLFGAQAGGTEQIEEEVRKETGLDLNDDILSWMGDLGAFAAGTSLEELRAGAVIETKDPDASRRALEVLTRIAGRGAGPDETVEPLTLPGGGDGFTLTAGELPQPLHVVQRGDRLAVALGDDSAEALLEPADTLGEDPDFADASGRLGEGFQASNYLDFAPILELAESVGAAEDEGYLEAKPYLEPFARMVAGTKKDGDIVFSRTRVEFR